MEQTKSEGESALALCGRYLATANRDYDRAIRTFYLMKENRLSEAERLEAEKALEAAKVPEKHATPNELAPVYPKSAPIPFPAPKSEANKPEIEVVRSRDREGAYTP